MDRHYPHPDEPEDPPQDTAEQNDDTGSSSLYAVPIPKKKRLSQSGSVSTSNAGTDGLAMPPLSQALRPERVSAVVDPSSQQQQQQQQPASHSMKRSHAAMEAATTTAEATAGKPKRHYIRVVNENPIILRIKTHGVPLTEGITSNNSNQEQRALRQARQATKKAVQYEEARLTDSDDFLTDTDEEAAPTLSASQKSRKKKRKVAAAQQPRAVGATAGSSGVLLPPLSAGAPVLLYDPTDAGPPEGTLPTLWYSREVFLNILVMEKILGYKVRTVVHLVTTPKEGEEEPYLLDHKTALRWQEKALQATPAVWNDTATRMAISRANPSRCPTLLAVAAQAEAKQAAKEGRTPHFVLRQSPTLETEEVLLVKWRGRSHWHCSWERPVDVINVDAGNNNIAKQKLKRYYQSQELAFGVHWKKVLADENANAAVHGIDVGHASASGDEYFPPQCLEVERILACDETEMDMNVLAVQRAKNAVEDEDPPQLDKAGRLDLMVQAPEVADVWDPEDNVRYVVKWKGLPFAEITWEYWRDIKRDAVDHAEDFWLRQQTPSAEEIRGAVMTPHPSVRDFKKLQASPVYGISSQKRPTANLPGQKSAPPPSEEDETTPEGFKLRSYQLEGLNWLLFNWWNKRSCILADEMGLGKTIQSTAFLRQLQTNSSTNIRGPFLIVAPLSLVGQWQSELASWAPDMNVVLYHGSADARSFLVDHEFYYSEPFVQKSVATKLKKQGITKFHVLITTYEVCLKDTAVLSKIKWRVLLVDEAHRLKNIKSRLFDELASVNRDYCVLLTGTPIANATEELFSLLHFCNPQTFTDRDDFLGRFGQMTDASQVNELHDLLRPYLLRRVKEDVEKSLPPKEETILEVTLTPIQKAYYKAIYERNTAFLFKGAKTNNTPSLMNVMMELRKCCNHPFLVKGAEERILNEAALKLREKAREEGKEPTPPEPIRLFADQLVKSSGKMVLMEKLLQKLFDGGHKVLVFSQMVRVLDLLEELLKLKRYKYERLDGSTSSSSRVAAVDRFKRKSCQRFVMLLSTRAGGLGLNLTAADIVIIFDSDWNPQNDLQAMARAHRIGQQRSVKIYRLLTAKTYEMHMFHSASLKLGLERAVLSQNREQGDDGDDSKSKKKSDREAQAKEIDELLKKGAYDVFRDDDDKEAEKFMESDIDQLLEKSSKKVTYGASSTSSLGSGLGSFSKASFVADTGSGEKDVDLDDPDFWAKAVGLDAPVETPEEVAAMLDDGVKRSRKQVQVYDPYADIAEAEERRKERIAMEKQLEKEEKEREKLEKQKKKDALKEKKKREREGLKQQQAVRKVAPTIQKSKVAIDTATESAKGKEDKASSVDTKPKKTKKTDRMRALRRAENENPVIEQVRQAWETSHRTRASAAILRFGFGRFCRIRSESNLTGLPIQDIEVFTRAFLYQISLQAGVNVFEFMISACVTDIRSLLPQWLGNLARFEIDWIAHSIISTMEYFKLVEERKRFLRIPVILCEPSYVTDLRNGGAFRALRRLGVLNRLSDFVEKCLDIVLTGLGHEELGKRGFVGNDVAMLDPDMKARFVTTEELSLVVSEGFGSVSSVAPASWWDRHCDISLVVGSFIHGLGNYKGMKVDSELPFSEKIKRNATRSFKASYQAFVVAASAARTVFDDALEAGRIKAELEVQAAVAAAAKAAAKREEEAALLREGGDGAEAVIRDMPETQVENAFEFDGTDSHFVTLKRLHSKVRQSLADKAREVLALDTIPEEFNEGSVGRPRADVTMGRPRSHILVSMPDARLLDHRLLEILAAVESPDHPHRAHIEVNQQKLGESSAVHELRRNVLLRFHGERLNDFLGEYSGIGIAGAQCGTTHRTLNDGTDFGYASASPPLFQVAYGTDAPRYLRALGIPINLTRFAIAALAYSDKKSVEQLLSMEHQKFYEMRQEKVLSSAVVADSTGTDATQKTETDAEKKDEHQIKTPPIQWKGTHPWSGDYAVRQHPLKASDLLSEPFRSNTVLRATICLGVLVYGFPREDCSAKEISQGIVAVVSQHEGQKFKLFDQNRFREYLSTFCEDLILPDTAAIAGYVESYLLPHCLRLCLYGNGPTTRDARGSQGEYETSLGVSVHSKPSKEAPCPLPDPCADLQSHSLEALGAASAILRRTQLLQSAQYVCSSGAFPAENIVEATRSKHMDTTDCENLPVWWCPWVHDIGLLVRTASSGVFAILDSRPGDALFSESAVTVFLKDALQKQPLHFVDHFSSPELHEKWVSFEAKKFPSLLQVERRLACLCSQVTCASPDEEKRFVILPMFDHGGWPRD